MTQGTPEEHEQFKKKLSEMSLEDIKKNLKLDIYGNWKKKVAENFVENEERKSDEQHKKKQLEISSEAVSVAREANLISKEANNTSHKAFWISVLSAVITIVAVLISFFHTQ